MDTAHLRRQRGQTPSLRSRGLASSGGERLHSVPHWTGAHGCRVWIVISGDEYVGRTKQDELNPLGSWNSALLAERVLHLAHGDRCRVAIRASKASRVACYADRAFPVWTRITLSLGILSRKCHGADHAHRQPEKAHLH